ncbi:MAG: hypothetical protein Q8835_02525 [Sweet potato little leaf phytoplasma]|nr:hypothetical protein [Sweet potato little leaf phytoplasma]
MRSQEDWLKEGDKNTKWVHSKASHRKKKNEIKGIFNKMGIWEENEEGIGKIANDHFKALLKSNHPDAESQMKVVSAIDTKLTEEQSQKLDSPFSKEEIERAIKRMNPSKAPGPDGAHALFYKKYWDIVGDDTVRVCLGILNEREEVDPINRTNITLIPKKKGSQIHERFQAYRPL